MALDLPPGARSVSPESSGRDSPIPKQWGGLLGTGEYLDERLAIILYLY